MITLDMNQQVAVYACGGEYIVYLLDKYANQTHFGTFNNNGILLFGGRSFPTLGEFLEYYGPYRTI